MNSRFSITIHFIVIFVMVFSLIRPHPVMAQEGTPPYNPTPTAKVPDLCASETPGKAEVCRTTLRMEALSRQSVTSGVPLTFYVNDNTSTAVFYNGVKQFYAEASEGVFLWVNNTVYGPWQANYTPISNTLKGTGTFSDPWVVTTLVSVGTTGLKLEQKVQYTNGESYLTSTWRVENSTNSPISYVLFHAADLYTQGSDVGYGYYNQSTNSIGGYNIAHTFFQYFRPIIPANHYYEGHYSDVWARIGASSGIVGVGFNDTVLSTQSVDNGAGLQWNRTAPAYSYDLVSDYLVFNTEGSLGPLLVPNVLTFGAVAAESVLAIHPSGPTDSWTLSENLNWLSLSSYSGIGDAYVTVMVNRGGLTVGDYSGAINAVTGSRTASATVTMRVATPQVQIISPTLNSSFYQGGTMLVKANVTLNGSPAIGLSVSGDMAPGFTFQLYDDGGHEDGLPSDGIYAARILMPGGQLVSGNGNNVSLIVYANAAGAVGSSSVIFNIITTIGIPTVTLVGVTGPSGTIYYKNQQLIFEVALSYGNSSVHNDALVSMVVTDPVTLAIQRYTFTYSGVNNHFTLTRSFPAGRQYRFDIQAQTPGYSGYADGWLYLPLEIYEGDLALNATRPSGSYNQYALVPIEACLTAGSAAIENAKVTALITPENESVFLKSKTESPGCYQFSYAPKNTGSHTVSFSANKEAYKPATSTLPFSVTATKNNLATIIDNFTQGAVQESNFVQYYTNLIAESGDFFKEKLSDDQISMSVDLVFDVFSIVTAVIGTDELAKQFFLSDPLFKPCGYDTVFDSLCKKLIKEATKKALINASKGLPISSAESMELLTSPNYYFASSGDFSRGEGQDLEEFIRREYENKLSTPRGLSIYFSDVLAQTSLELQSKIQDEATLAKANSSGFTETEEKAYYYDFAYRSTANYYFGSADLRNRSDLLILSRLRREARDADYQRKVIIFLAEVGLKVGLSYLLGPAGTLVSSVALGAMHAYANSKDIAADQKFRDQAVSLLNRAYNAQTFVSGNTFTGLSNVIDRIVPNTPKAKIISTDDVKTQSVFFTKEVYTDVTIKNVGSVTADFGVLDLYRTGEDNWLGYNIYSTVTDDIVDVSTGKAIRYITLTANEARTLRVYYKHGNSDYGAPNKYGYGIAAFAYSGDSVYVTDTKNVYPFSPRTVPVSQQLVSEEASLSDVNISTANQFDATSSKTEFIPLAPSVMQSNMEEFAIFPIRAYVHNNHGQLNDTFLLGVDNPYPSPLAVRISQPLLSNMTITNYHDAKLVNGAITWYRVLEPHESAILEYDFAYRGGYGISANMPSAAMAFYDPSNNTDVTLNTGVTGFLPSLPVTGSASGPTSALPKESLTTTALVKSLDPSNSRTISVVMTIKNVAGVTVVGPLTQNSTLNPLASQSFTFHYAAPAAGGTYSQEVVLNFGSSKQLLKADLLSINSNMTYLPLFTKNPPNNDDIYNAWSVSPIPYQSTQNTSDMTNASDDPIIPGINRTGYYTVWYRMVVPQSATYCFTTNGSSYDTVTALWMGMRGSLISITSSDDTGEGRNELFYQYLTSGQVVYIEIAGYSTSSLGNLILRITK